MGEAADTWNLQAWNPPLSGDMDLLIKANGEWYHEGSLITRPSLVKLFASILRREGEDYFLVSPVEKWRIQVEDVPFLVIEVGFEETTTAEQQKVKLHTATGDTFFLDEEHPLRMVYSGEHSLRPYVTVRQGMDALIHRNVFYRLSDRAVSHEGKTGLWSCGAFFSLV